MGCYDSVCSVSHIPIGAGDPVVLFYLGQREKSGQAAPITLPIFGNYNDYGDIEDYDESSISWQRLMNLIETSFSEVLKPNRSCDNPLDVFRDKIHMNSDLPMPDQWVPGLNDDKRTNIFEPRQNSSDEEYFEMVQSNGSRVTKMLVHRHIFDWMIEHFKQRNISWNNDDLGQLYFDQIPEYVDALLYREKITREMFSNMKEISDEEEKLNEMMKVYNVYGMDPLAPHKESGGETFHEYHFLPQMFKSSGSRVEYMYWAAISKMRNDIQTMLQKNNRDELIELVNEVTTLAAFFSSLSYFNMEYHGFGGFANDQHQQTDDAKRMQDLFKMFGDVQQAKIDKWEDEYEE